MQDFNVSARAAAPSAPISFHERYCVGRLLQSLVSQLELLHHQHQYFYMRGIMFVDYCITLVSRLELLHHQYQYLSMRGMVLVDYCTTLRDNNIGTDGVPSVDDFMSTNN